MQFFIDSADPAEIKRACDVQIVSGVTTNPGLMGREGRGENPREALEKILEAARGRLVFCQVLSREAKAQVEEAKRLARLATNLAIKVVMNEQACASIPAMLGEGIQVAATAVNTVSRAILAANAGAQYVIPYYGWIEHTVDRPTNLIGDITIVYRAQGYATKVLMFARDPSHILQGAAAGAWGCTMEPKDLYKVFFHPQSEVAVADHRQGWVERFGDITWLDVL